METIMETYQRWHLLLVTSPALGTSGSRLPGRGGISDVHLDTPPPAHHHYHHYHLDHRQWGHEEPRPYRDYIDYVNIYTGTH